MCHRPSDCHKPAASTLHHWRPSWLMENANYQLSTVVMVPHLIIMSNLPFDTHSKFTMAARVSSVFRSGLFSGKTAIVTGGATGIGKAISSELLYLGCNVMLASRKVERLEKSVEELRHLIESSNNRTEKPKVDFVECNIRKEDQVKNLISSTLEKFGKLDFLVNNGGGQFFGPAKDFSLNGWNAVVETNLTGTFMCCREAHKQYMGENGGMIVNMVANMWNGWPGMAHSGAARAGVENITKSLAIEWAPDGIRINAVAPGSTIHSQSVVDYYDFDVMGQQIPRVPAKRLGTVEEVSAVVAFLLSPAAAFITGETIRIDAGQSLYTTSVPWDVPDHKKLPAYTWESDVENSNKE